ncbi:MAG: 3'-5' exonuclease [Simkaniaceae bacterium]|nr:3'-5' exonuclease [Simkaniaceae bacterium]
MIGIFLDTETNGLNFQRHHIIEIAYKMVDLTTDTPIYEYSTLIKPSIEEWEESDRESLNINGFTWEETQKGHSRASVAKEIQASFTEHRVTRDKYIFICQNPSFDRAFFSKVISSDIQESLNWPYHWLDLASMFFAKTMIDAKSQKAPYPWESGLSKNKIAKYYNLPEEQHPHRALNGVNHLIKCYNSVIN